MSYAKRLSLLRKVICSNLNVLDAPYKLNFAVTYKCNSRCRICFVWKKKPGNELTLDEIDRIFEKAGYFSWVSLTGGEPFLRDDIVDIARILKKRCKNLYLLNIATNGLLTDTIYEKVKEIISLGIPRCVITVSLDGPEDVHEKIRGIRGAWWKSVGTFKKLKALAGENFDVFFEFTLCPYNMGRFMDTYQSVKREVPDISLNDFYVSLFHYSDHVFLNQELDDASFKKNVVEEVDALCKIKNDKLVNLFNPYMILPYMYLKMAKIYVRTGRTPLACRSLYTNCYINPEGYVFPCHIFGESIGNLREEDYDLKKLLNSDAGQELKGRISRLECPRCWTPCEAYPMILGNAIKGVKQTIFNKSSGR
jgi:radical SAM protein with 4Fe4S-binding SPASM domain